MSKKGKKRPLNDSELANNHVSSGHTNKLDEKLHLKKKLKVKADNESDGKVKSKVKLIEKSSNNNVLSNSDLDEKLKKLKEKKDKMVPAHLKTKIKTDKLRKVKDGKVDGSKKKERNKKKRQDRLEARKVVRQEEGQHSAIMKMSVDELKKRINEIESRENISKTAVRKLRVLKVKLKVEEGTADSKESSEQKKNVLEKNNIDESKVPKDESGNDKNGIKNKSSTKTSPKSKKKKNVKTNETQNSLFIEDRIGNKLENNEDSVTKTNLSKKELKKLKKEEKKKAKHTTIEHKGKNQVKNTNTTDKSSKNKSTKELINVNTNKFVVKSPKNSKINQNAKKTNLKVNEDMSEDDDELDNVKNKVSYDNHNDSEDKNDDSDDENECEDREIVSDDDNDVDNQDDDGNDDDDSNNDDDDDDQDGDESKLDITKIINQKVSKKESTDNKKDKKKDNHTQDNVSTDKLKKEKTVKLKKEKQKEGSEESPDKKTRYVLFVGNVNYETTTVDLKKHFLTKVDKVKDVRIPLKPGTNTPRGFAYVEFENSVDYEKALSLHKTTLNGRPINVLYTTSGSKTANKKQEIIHKNKKLHAMRRKGMLAGSKKNNQKRSFRRNFDKQSKKD